MLQLLHLTVTVWAAACRVDCSAILVGLPIGVPVATMASYSVVSHCDSSAELRQLGSGVPSDTAVGLACL